MAQNVGEKPMMWTWPIFALFLKKITGTPINSPVGKKGQKKTVEKTEGKGSFTSNGYAKFRRTFPCKN